MPVRSPPLRASRARLRGRRRLGARRSWSTRRGRRHRDVRCVPPPGACSRARISVGDEEGLAYGVGAPSRADLWRIHDAPGSSEAPRRDRPVGDRSAREEPADSRVGAARWIALEERRLLVVGEVLRASASGEARQSDAVGHVVGDCVRARHRDRDRDRGRRRCARFLRSVLRHAPPRPRPLSPLAIARALGHDRGRDVALRAPAGVVSGRQARECFVELGPPLARTAVLARDRRPTRARLGIASSASSTARFGAFARGAGRASREPAPLPAERGRRACDHLVLGVGLDLGTALLGAIPHRREGRERVDERASLLVVRELRERARSIVSLLPFETANAASVTRSTDRTCSRLRARRDELGVPSSMPRLRAGGGRASPPRRRAS